MRGSPTCGIAFTSVKRPMLLGASSPQADGRRGRWGCRRWKCEREIQNLKYFWCIILKPFLYLQVFGKSRASLIMWLNPVSASP